LHTPELAPATAAGQIARSQRERWALPGGRHDRLIGLLSFLLPVLVGVLAAFLVMAPLYTSGDVSFVLDKNSVEVAKERLRIQAARYRGQDGKGQPFMLNAGSAVQRTSAEPVVELRDLDAAIQLSDGPARLHADQGRYDMDSEQVRIDGPVAVTGPDGYRLNTQDPVVDLKARTLQSGGGVTGEARQGRFSAQRLTADLESRTVRLTGGARLRIDPRATR
jgi:lipopolysaccharide export system protein LptC